VRFLGPSAVIEIVEGPQDLLVRVTAVRRYVDYLPLIIAIVVFGFILAGKSVPLASSIWFAVVIAVFVWQVIRARNGELRVTEGSFDAVHYLGKRSVRWEQVKKLKYRMASRHLPKGLYAVKNFLLAYCLAPGLNRDQCNEVITAIQRKFPSFNPEGISGVSAKADPMGSIYMPPPIEPR
jgi:hypothetical protein